MIYASSQRFLNFSGNRIAFDYYIWYNKKNFPLKAGYDEDYKRYSPGHILTIVGIMGSFANLDLEYEFLGEYDQYKSRMANSSYQLYKTFIFNKGMPSRFLKFLYFDVPRILDRLGIKKVLKNLCR